MIQLSLGLNVLVLTPIVIGMAVGSSRIEYAWGEFTAARGILASIYFALLVLSLALLFKTVPVFVVPLLATQVIYKLTTPFTVGTLLNPVVMSNLAISVLHAITLWTIYKNRHILDLKQI